jgi:hypothetical protein
MLITGKEFKESEEFKERRIAAKRHKKRKKGGVDRARFPYHGGIASSSGSCRMVTEAESVF